LTTYKIIELEDNSKEKGATFRGGARQLWKSKDPEIILSGPADTGKTFGALHKLDALMWKYPGANGAIVRKTNKSLYGSVCVTFQTKVANMKAINAFGGDKSPERYIYPNGSVLWLGGMDNPDKVLSSERDFIYVNQAEELQEGDWETLKTRCNGRAGNSPYAQLFGDCNPGGSLHWIKERTRRGVLTLLISSHLDNPTIYANDGSILDTGKPRLAALESLTGVRRKRLLEGIWATAEGAVYDMFDPAIHVIQRDPYEFRTWALAMDEGYTNPAVILLVGIDADGRWHVAREFYERGKLQRDVVQVACAWGMAEYQAEIIAVDAAAAGLIADLRDAGLSARASKGRVLDGINNIQARLKVQGDGRPRLTVSPDCVNVINEFESHVWRPGKDEPVKENDHSLDALRYLDDLTSKGSAGIDFI
jgi:PBSX family phage terminase large subunit